MKDKAFYNFQNNRLLNRPYIKWIDHIIFLVPDNSQTSFAYSFYCKAYSLSVFKQIIAVFHAEKNMLLSKSWGVGLLTCQTSAMDSI